jgi:hypothetical protein
MIVRPNRAELRTAILGWPLRTTHGRAQDTSDRESLS